MTLNARLLAAAAVLVALFGAGLVALNAVPGVGTHRSPEPSEVRSPIPTALRAIWVSDRARTFPKAHGTYAASVQLAIDATKITIPAFKADVRSAAELVGQDGFELRLLDSDPDWGCQSGEVGTYAFATSRDGARLTLTPLTDPCAARMRILEGEWLHTDMGALAPGEHVSALFRPYYPVSGAKLSYTVPAGWTEGWESDVQLSLTRDQGTASLPAIDVLADVGPYHQEGVGPVAPNGLAASCDESGSEVVGTPAVVAQWLASLPALIVSKPTPVSIGGLDGVIVDVAVAPGWINTCSVGGAPEGTVGVVYDAPAYSFGNQDGPALSVFGDERARYVLLDRGSGRSLVIAVSATDATWDATMAEVMPVIETFEFAP